MILFKEKKLAFTRPKGLGFAKFELFLRNYCVSNGDAATAMPFFKEPAFGDFGGLGAHATPSDIKTVFPDFKFFTIYYGLQELILGQYDFCKQFRLFDGAPLDFVNSKYADFNLDYFTKSDFLVLSFDEFTDFAQHELGIKGLVIDQNEFRTVTEREYVDNDFLDAVYEKNPLKEPMSVENAWKKPEKLKKQSLKANVEPDLKKENELTIKSEELKTEFQSEKPFWSSDE